VAAAKGGVPQVAKVAAIAALPCPTDVTSVRAFFGVINYYQQFIPECSRVQAPLNALTKKGAVWEGGATGAGVSSPEGGLAGGTGSDTSQTWASIQSPL
jgi:hypothetical protein